MLFNIIYTVFLILLICVALASIIIRRKVHGIKGVKPFLSSGCLFTMGLLNLLSGWFKFYGLTVWGITFVLLFLAAYLTKYAPDSNGKAQKQSR